MKPALGPTTRCCGLHWHRQTTRVRVCSTSSRLLATLGPRSAGLTALTTAPRTLIRTGSCLSMPNRAPQDVGVDDLFTSVQFRMSVDNQDLDEFLPEGPQRARLDWKDFGKFAPDVDDPRTAPPWDGLKCTLTGRNDAPNVDVAARAACLARPHHIDSQPTPPPAGTSFGLVVLTPPSSSAYRLTRSGDGRTRRPLLSRPASANEFRFRPHVPAHHCSSSVFPSSASRGAEEATG